MDDLYNNAWGDSSAAWGSPVISPSTQHSGEAEADLANPSWPTGPELKWDQPSDQDSGFTWSATEPDLAWSSSTYGDISVGKPEGDPTSDEVPTTPTAEEVAAESTDEGDTTESTTTDDAPPVGLGIGLPAQEEHNSPAATPDPDGFGTFEDATTTNALETELGSSLEDESWGSPWAAGPAEDEHDTTKPVDEWELARKNKEQLDRKVPPELLADIISRCEEYFHEIMKSKESKGSASKEDSWMEDWRSGIEGIEGLEVTMRTLVPELTLQPAPQFTKTAIAKNMAGCVRVTKNLPLSKGSPMSHYLAAKGSTAWEAAVKQQKGFAEDDVVPVGWRIVDKQNSGASEQESPTGSKASGGLFSFWARRQSKPPTPAVTASKESSPTRPSTPSHNGPRPGDADSQSERPSIDTVRTPSLSSDKDRQPSPASDPTPRQNSQDIIASTSLALPATYADAPEPEVDLQAQPAQPPPSAVSRFLNRFSRKRSSLGSASPRSSLALSTDDLEFLSDIVPSASDNHDDDDDQFKSLNNILKPEPLPPALPPPPLAPPPRPASAATAPSQPGSATHTRTSSLLSTADQSSLPSLTQTPQNDLDDLFGAFEESPTSSSASGITPALAASVPVAVSPGRVLTRSQSPRIPAPHSRTSSPSPLSFSNTLVPSQVGLPSAALPLPPPPPSSSAIPPSLPQRSATEPTESTMSRRASLKPKVPLSFKIPPPPIDVSPSLPSASEIPLAQLYPQAAARQQAQQKTTESPPRRPSLPVQPSRSHTPVVMSQAPLNPTTVSAPLLAPPPGSSRPPATATNLLGDDDDEFDDFQSSAPAVGGASSSFSLPPPPSASTKPAPLAPLLPPPSSFTPSFGASPSTPQPLSSDPLSDDFGALLSSSMSLDSQRSRVSGLSSTFQSDRSLISTPYKRNPLEFDDASPVSSALRTPSPPRLPSKSAKPSLALDPPPIPAPPSILSPEERQARVTQHMRTLSLMERAAARPGQWPAPPSPLPQAISFGVLGEAPKKAVDLLGDDESFGSFAEEGIKPLPSVPGKLESIAEAPAPARAQTASPSAWGALVPPSAASTVQPSAPSASQKSGGGLSAQDLSFFEGLY